MEAQFSRTERLYGKAAVRRLSECRVAVFGIGGVGGYAAEALARSGVGMLDLIDHDTVSVSNINRQIIALHSTVGRRKVEVMAERIRDINPDCQVRIHPCFYLPENAGSSIPDRDGAAYGSPAPDGAGAFDFTEYDYVVDAIDTVTGKIGLILQAKAAGTPIISCMGAGNKIHPDMFEIADIYETSVCPLAKVMRRELKRRGIEHLKVVYSKEPPRTPIPCSEEVLSDAERTEAPDAERRKVAPGSCAFAPSVAGLLMASEVVNDLTGNFREDENGRLIK